MIMAMGNMISPGVYSRIIDLSEYLADIPGTIGFIPILSKRGPDNKLIQVTSKEQFINLYGQPNISDYGKQFGQGPYIAWQHLGVSSHLYVLRALPSDATFSHLFIGMQLVSKEVTNVSSSVVYNQDTLEMAPFYSNGIDEGKNSINHVQELDTILGLEDPSLYINNTDTGGTAVPSGVLMYFRGLGRGASYNDFAIQLSRHTNSQMFGVYVLDIYETQSDGDDVVIESFNVSFDENAVDDSGEALFIEEVVNKFSKNVRCKVNRDALRQLELYKTDYYKNDETLPEPQATYYRVADENGMIVDWGYKQSCIEVAKMDYTYATAVLEEKLAALTIARAMPTTTISEITARNEALNVALGELSTARADVAIAKAALNTAYQLDIMMLGDGDSTLDGVQPFHFDYGSEGSLVYQDQETGKILPSTEEAIQVLSEAYLGTLIKSDNPIRKNGTYNQYCDEVFDLDWIYFSLCYDGGYPDDVKSAARTLVNDFRLDCMLISDCGDNTDYQECEDAVGGNPSVPTYIWNSKYCARYESYSKIYDSFTGRDIWISPVYHMASMIPLNDRLYEIWYASAGFNRGTISSIKELRWSPKLGERDNLYLLQINPIVHFPQGYTVWGNLTTQKRPTALQDVNVMRCVLYIKRALEQYCKYFIFDFNDATTWKQIKAGIIPFLDRIKSRRGLVEFSVDVGASEWEFKNKICHVNVTLKPMKVIEKIELNLYIK